METSPDTYQHLFYGYTVIWIFLAMLVFSCINKQRKLVKEVEELKSKLGSF